MMRGCITHDEVVEQIDLNLVLKATRSICSALGFKLGKSWEAFPSCQKCRGPVLTSLLCDLMLSSRVMIFKAVFYTLYTKDQMGSNGRISVRKDEQPMDLDLIINDIQNKLCF